MSSLSKFFHINLFRKEIVGKFISFCNKSELFSEKFSINKEGETKVVIALITDISSEQHRNLLDWLSNKYYSFCKKHNLSYSCPELASRNLLFHDVDINVSLLKFICLR